MQSWLLPRILKIVSTLLAKTKKKDGGKQYVLDLSSIQIQYIDDNEISGPCTFHFFLPSAARENTRKDFIDLHRRGELALVRLRLWCSMNSNGMPQVLASWRYCTMNNYRETINPSGRAYRFTMMTIIIVYIYTETSQNIKLYLHTHVHTRT